MEPLYPAVQVKLTGQDGNSFFIVGRIRSALERAGVPADKVDEFSTEAMAGDYDNVLRTAMRWISVS